MDNKIKFRFSGHELLKVIALIGVDVYEREVLRFILCRYHYLSYRHSTDEPIRVRICSTDFIKMMSRNKFIYVLKAIERRQFIERSLKNGRGGHHVIELKWEAIIPLLDQAKVDRH